MKFRALFLAVLSAAAVLSFSESCLAGTWTCNTGLNGKPIYKIVFTGNELGQMASSALVSVAGLPGGPMPVQMESPQAGELTRVLVGAYDPRSKTELWIMQSESAPGVHPAFSKLSSFPVQSFEGDCGYAP